MPSLTPDEVRRTLIERCGADREDAEAAAAALPGAPSDLLDRLYRTIEADMGGLKWLEWPQPPPEQPLAGLYPLLAAVPLMDAFHRERGLDRAASDLVLADIGEKLRLNRRLYGRAGLDVAGWFTGHLRGALYQLGRLQFCVEGVESKPLLGMHIRGEGGPLAPEAVAEAVARAAEFFPRAFPERFGSGRTPTFTCTSWLLDPQLRDWLPERSNILKFASLFDLVGPASQPGTNGQEDVWRFAFAATPGTPVEDLPEENTLQRALLGGIRAGVRWQVPLGVLDPDRLPR